MKTFRSPFKGGIFLLALAALLFSVITLPGGVEKAEAHQSPPGCVGANLALGLFRSPSTIPNGTVVNYTLFVRNLGFGGCDVDGATVSLIPPDATGAPAGAPIPLAAAASLPASGLGNSCWRVGPAIGIDCPLDIPVGNIFDVPALAVTINVNLGVIDAIAAGTVAGVLHDESTNHDAGAGNTVGTSVIHPATTLTLVSQLPANPVLAGTPVTIILRETNTGDGTLTAVSVTGTGCTPYSPASVASLAPLAFADFSCTFSPAADTTWTALGHGTDSTGNPVPAINEDEAGNVDTFSPATTLTLVSQLPANPVLAGTPVTIILRETNTGDVTLTAVNVTGTGCSPYSPASVASLAPLAFADFSCTFSPAADTAWTALGHGTDPAGNPVPAINEDEAGNVDTIDPRITIVKTAGNAANNTVLNIQPGDLVTFHYRVCNTGDVPLVPASVTDDNGTVSLLDDFTVNIAGGLGLGQCTDVNSAAIPFPTPPVCGAVHTNVATASGTAGNVIVTATDNATLCTPPSGGNTFPTQTECQDFNSGTAIPLDLLGYTSGGSPKLINQNVTPGVFFYWSRVVSTGGTLSIVQEENSTNGDHRFKVHQRWARLYTANCSSWTQLPIAANGIDVTGPIPSGTFIVGIKYDSKSIVGKVEPTPQTVEYTFKTLVGAVVVDQAAPPNLTLQKK